MAAGDITAEAVLQPAADMPAADLKYAAMPVVKITITDAVNVARQRARTKDVELLHIATVVVTKIVAVANPMAAGLTVAVITTK